MSLPMLQEREFNMMLKLIVKEIWRAKNCGKLLFVEEYDSKVAYDYNNGDNIEDGFVHERLPFRFYRPQIDDKRQYSGKDIESQEIHWVLSFFDNFTDILKKDTVMAIPIENVSQGFMPVALGTNAPTTKEANRIFAPSKKKSETISNLSLSNIQRKFTIQSAICQDKGETLPNAGLGKDLK